MNWLIYSPAGRACYNQHEKSQQKANIGIGWNKAYKRLFLVFKRLVQNYWIFVGHHKY